MFVHLSNLCGGDGEAKGDESLRRKASRGESNACGLVEVHPHLLSLLDGRTIAQKSTFEYRNVKEDKPYIHVFCKIRIANFVLVQIRKLRFM